MPFSRFIQVDAPLNPGNSGPCSTKPATSSASLIGISESQGLNFAIAVSSVDRVIGDWVETKKPSLVAVAMPLIARCPVLLP